MKVSYIVSAYDRPELLRCCLASLAAQTDRNREIIVADNSPAQVNRRIAEQFDVRYFHTNMFDCYWAAEWVVAHEARGEWLCFPSDDSYYAPIFQETLLDTADKNGWQLVYCDMVYDRRIGGRYSVLNVEPRLDHIDKTGFLLNRGWWIGFPDKPSRPGPCAADGMMIDRIMATRIRHGKVPEVLVVHN